MLCRTSWHPDTDHVLGLWEPTADVQLRLCVLVETASPPGLLWGERPGTPFSLPCPGQLSHSWGVPRRPAPADGSGNGLPHPLRCQLQDGGPLHISGSFIKIPHFLKNGEGNTPKCSSSLLRLPSAGCSLGAVPPAPATWGPSRARPCRASHPQAGPEPSQGQGCGGAPG